MSNLPKGYTIPPDQNFSTLYSDIIKTDNIIVGDTVSFFGSGNISQQSSDYTIEDVYKLLMNYGLISPQTWVIESTHLDGIGSVGPSSQGYSVAISEDNGTSAVGGPDDDGGIGAAWIFHRTRSSWYQQAKLIGTGATGFANQGTSISMSLDGYNIVISGPNNDGGIGASWVFTRTGDVWSQQDILIGSSNIGNSKQGMSVAMSDDANTIAIGGPDDGGGIGATWIFIKTGFTWVQQAKLVGTGNIGNSRQGTSVVLSSDGDTVSIGGSGDNGGIGSVWIFIRTGITWSQQEKLIGSGNIGNSLQGMSVDMTFDGDVIVLGGPGDNGGIGAIWIFTRNGIVWTQETKLIGSGNIGNSSQGTSVAIQTTKNMIVSGGPNDNNGVGAFWTWIYSEIDQEWQQSRDKIYSTLYYGTPIQGYSISFHGTTAIIGGPGDNEGIGAVWIYNIYSDDNTPVKYNTYYTIPESGNYSSITSELFAPKSLIVGDEISLFGSSFNTRLNSYPTIESVVNMLRSYGFAYTSYYNNQQVGPLTGSGSVGNSSQGSSTSLSSDGNIAAIGGSNDDGDIGAIWIFIRTDNIWTQMIKLVGTGNIGNSLQGYSVSLSSDGTTLAVGGPGDNGSIGATWIFTRTNSSWTQQAKLVSNDNSGNSGQGTSVSLSSDGNTLVVGGKSDDSDKGAAWIFVRTGIIWTQQGSKLVGSGLVGNSFQGTSVSISSNGDTVSSGGYGDNGEIGAVWIFVRSGITWTQQGSKLIGSGSIGNSRQGMSVSISSDGDTIAFGGDKDDGDIGAVWVFTRTDDIWTQQGYKLVGTEYIGLSQQGISVSLSSNGNILSVGGYKDNIDVGAIWVFTRTDEMWTQPGDKLQGTRGIYNTGPMFQGTSVTISSDGETIIFGGTSYNSIGAFWVYIHT